MKLGSLKSDTPDGQLVVLSRDLAFAKAVPDIAPTMQSALDRWDKVEAALMRVSDDLNAGRISDAMAFDPANALSPLPRTDAVIAADYALLELYGCRFDVEDACPARPPIPRVVFVAGVPSAVGAAVSIAVGAVAGVRAIAARWRAWRARKTRR